MTDLTPEQYRQLIRDIFSGLRCFLCGIRLEEGHFAMFV